MPPRRHDAIAARACAACARDGGVQSTRMRTSPPSCVGAAPRLTACAPLSPRGHRRKLPRMPELPEVETTRRGLAPHLEGRRVAGVVLRRPDLRWPIPPEIADAAARPAHRRRAPPRQIPAARHRRRQRAAAPGHVRQPARAAGRHAGDGARPRRPRARAGGARRVLRFNDPRRFGCLLWQPPGETHDCCAASGPEPLSDDFDGDYLFARSRGRSAPVKTFLMDQRIVVGVGNIYAAEALFAAGISPLRAAGRVSRERYARAGRRGASASWPTPSSAAAPPCATSSAPTARRAISSRNCPPTAAAASPARAADGR